MKEPVYRWLCPMCGVADEAESSEMARLNIDVHMGIAHPTSSEAVRVQLDPNRDILVLDDRVAGDLDGDEDDDRSSDA
jgi:hypothetical protein